jgi:hypothetical protein
LSGGEKVCNYQSLLKAILSSPLKIHGYWWKFFEFHDELAYRIILICLAVVHKRI